MTAKVTYPVMPMTEKNAAARARILVPAFGAALARARGAQPIGTFLARLAEYSKALAKVDQTRVNRYQAGAVEHPDALLVRAWAEITGTNFLWLLDVLRWNREHPTRKDVPAQLDTTQQEAGMRVTGTDRDLLRRFHSLPTTVQDQIYDFMKIHETIAAAAPRGAAATAPTFRPRVKGRG